MEAKSVLQEQHTFVVHNPRQRIAEYLFILSALTLMTLCRKFPGELSIGVGDCIVFFFGFCLGFGFAFPLQAMDSYGARACRQTVFRPFG